MIERPLENKELGAISNLGLAYIGDGVYELLIRTHLVTQGGVRAGEMHKTAITYVKAGAQARAADVIKEQLSEEELAVYKRGRNAKTGSLPRGATPAEYHAATGLEALFGYLYLRGEKDRIKELFAAIMEGSQCP